MNASKPRESSGPFYRDRIAKEKSDVSKHIDEAIETVLEEGRTPELEMSKNIDCSERIADDNIHREFDEIIEMINQDGENKTDRVLEDMQGVDQSWEENSQ